MSTTDDFGNLVYPGSADNGATDMEYSPAIERKICAADERFASVNEAIGRLEYNLEQHIEKCADGLAPLADFITSSWAVIDELEARIAALEAAARPTMDENGVWVSHDAWDDMQRQLTELQAFKGKLDDYIPWRWDDEMAQWQCGFCNAVLPTDDEPVSNEATAHLHMPNCKWYAPKPSANAPQEAAG